MPGCCGEIQGLWPTALALPRGLVRLTLRGPTFGSGWGGWGWESGLVEGSLAGIEEQGNNSSKLSEKMLYVPIPKQSGKRGKKRTR